MGHACSPDRGSEPGITWNWAWHLSAYHEVWLLAHPEYREHVERFLAARPNPNLHIVWITPPSWLDPWNPSGRRRGIRIHYLLWQRAAVREAARLHQSHRFDLTHYVSPATVSAPPSLWRLPIPFVWGPLGGGQVTPGAFRRYFAGARIEEDVRTMRVRLLSFLPAVRRAVKESAMLLATNEDTARVLYAARARTVRLFLDVGVPPEYVPPSPPQHPPRAQLTLLWAGRLEPRKALPLALEALARVADLPVRLLVAGDGPRRTEWERLAQGLGVADRVRFLGRVPWDGLPELFREADAFLFTSLRDSSGTVVLEAMAHALPVVALGHQGVDFFVPREAGIKVPVTTPAATVDGLALGVRTLARNPEARTAMGEAAWRTASGHTWDRRARTMSEWYGECTRR